SRVLAGEVPKALGWKLADKLVYSQVRARMGGKVEIFISGGAPLGKELAAWYASMGIRIHEGYGLTETSPVIAINTPLAHRMGTVGRPLPNVEVQIADDWEILVRGPSVFQGYWNRPEETRNAFVDGWFKTGDIGKLDDNGFLSVTDRKKDLLKTSGGKFIAPQPIENSIKLNALIGTAVVLGDRRKFAFVIISPCFPLLEDWARANHIPFSSRQELVANPKVKDLYEGIVAKVNQGLARFETLKKVLLVPDEFTAIDGVLTPTLKLRRKAVEERYRKQIDELYEETEVTSLT
ncbi:MAG: AMP-binding protein, partial [Candidatus Sulfotelmatobacter sp.]